MASHRRQCDVMRLLGRERLDGLLYKQHLYHGEEIIHEILSPIEVDKPWYNYFIANTRSMFALLYQFWFYIFSPENELSQFMVAAILGETGSSKFIARLVTIQVLLSNFMMQNNCFMITLRLIISRYHNSHFCWRFA